ncbi:MAG: zinc ABC transporter substrate-binding protein, partial [Planctomycetota bacterium]
MDIRTVSLAPVIRLAFALGVSLGLVGCDRGGEPAGTATAGTDAPVAIVATTGMIGDVVSAIGGDRVAVTTLIGPGIDPHLYQPTRDDIVAIRGARLVFYNGLLLEGKMTDALVSAATEGRKVFAVTELLSESDLLEPEDYEGAFDPHVWMD